MVIRPAASSCKPPSIIPATISRITLAGAQVASKNSSPSWLVRDAASFPALDRRKELL
ncbi:hypothetical protein BDZ94DRAFT_1245735, partial [Collybia nuda]